MNKIQKLRYIKNCDDRWKVLFKFYDYLKFIIHHEASQETYMKYWSFVIFCNSALYDFKMSEVRNFTNAENHIEVFEDIKKQFENIEVCTKIAWADDFEISFNDQGKIRILLPRDE